MQHNLLRDLRVDRGGTGPTSSFFDIQPDQRDDVAARVTQRDGPAAAPAVPIVPMRIRR